MRKKSGPGVRDIAAELGLNISTVSRALNRSYLISRDTTELVLRKAHEMGYHFERTRKCIVVLLPSGNTELAWYSLSLINALQKRLSETPYYWEFVNEDKADIIQERSVSGIISLEFTLRIAGMINRKYNIPLVCINNASSHADNAWSVNSDAEDGVRKAFLCLREYGHRSIAFISTSGMSFAGDAAVRPSTRSRGSTVCARRALPFPGTWGVITGPCWICTAGGSPASSPTGNPRGWGSGIR